MVMANDKSRKVSIGLIISSEDIKSNKIIPKGMIKSLDEPPYYLFIYIFREKIAKINIFPVENRSIKKILINLEDFSPDLVKNISNVFKKSNLSDYILHSTGVCYSEEFCFYENYLTIEKIKGKIAILDEMKNNLLKIPKVIDVFIEDIPVL
jgi:hypothetical protein